MKHRPLSVLFMRASISNTLFSLFFFFPLLKGKYIYIPTLKSTLAVLPNLLFPLIASQKWGYMKTIWRLPILFLWFTPFMVTFNLLVYNVKISTEKISDKKWLPLDFKCSFWDNWMSMFVFTRWLLLRLGYYSSETKTTCFAAQLKCVLAST